MTDVMVVMAIVLAAAARTAAGANAAAPDQPANPALAATAQAAPAAPIPATPGGAVFGFYPQLAGGKRTTYAMDDKLRTGVQATGPSTFAPATPSERTIIGGGNGQRMNAAQDPRSLTYGATAGNDAAAPVAPAAPNPTDQRIAVGAQQAPASATAPTATATAPTTQPASAMVAPGAYRYGRGQYGDSPTGQQGVVPGPAGQPNAQNMAAADALVARQTPAGFQPSGSQPAGVQAPVVRNSSNDWAARNNLRNLEVSASSITNQPGFSRGGRGYVPPDVAAYQAALQTDAALQQAQPGMDKAAMDSNTALQREGIQQAGATGRTAMQEQGANAREAGRTALAQGEFGLKREAAGFQTRAAAQQEQLRNVLLDQKSTPEQRAVARAALSGKTAADRMQTVALPDTTNEMGQVVRGGQALVRVLEDGTVQQVPIGAQQGAALPPGMKRQIGTSNGRPVYEDMNGKQVIAKG